MASHSHVLVYHGLLLSHRTWELRQLLSLGCTYIITSGQIIIFHQATFPWNKGISLTKPPFGVRSCEVAIIWPDNITSDLWHSQVLGENPSHQPTRLESKWHAVEKQGTVTEHFRSSSSISKKYVWRALIDQIFLTYSIKQIQVPRHHFAGSLLSKDYFLKEQKKKETAAGTCCIHLMWACQSKAIIDNPFHLICKPRAFRNNLSATSIAGSNIASWRIHHVL